MWYSSRWRSATGGELSLPSPSKVTRSACSPTSFASPAATVTAPETVQTLGSSCTATSGRSQLLVPRWFIQ